jgi:hypothetical protein
VKSNDGFVESYLLSDDTTMREDRDDAALLTSTPRTGSWWLPRKTARL